MRYHLERQLDTEFVGAFLNMSEKCVFSILLADRMWRTQYLYRQFLYLVMVSLHWDVVPH